MIDLDEVIKTIQQGSKGEYAKIIDIYQQPLYRYLVHLMGDTYEAQDVLQEVFIRTYQHIKSYKLNQSFSAWIYKIAHNQAINNMKKRRRIKVFSSFNFDFQKQLEEKLDRPREYGSINTELSEALLQLSSQDRSLIYLRILEERTYDEISNILGGSSSSLRKRFERAKKKIKENYELNSRRHENEGVYCGTKG